MCERSKTCAKRLVRKVFCAKWLVTQHIHVGHLGCGVSRQEKTSEWIAVKLVKWEFKSLRRFSTKISLLDNGFHSLCHNFSQNAIHVSMTTSILVDMRGETLPIIFSRGLWFLFDVHMAFNNCKSNICKFSFSHLMNNTLQIYRYLQMIQDKEKIWPHVTKLHFNQKVQFPFYSCNSHCF